MTRSPRRPIDPERVAGLVLAAAILAAVVWATAEGYGDLPESLPPHVYAGGTP